MHIKVVRKSERLAVYMAVLSMVYLPVFWGVGYSYRWYGEHPWPGVALYSHLGLLGIIIVSLSRVKKIASASYAYGFFVMLYLVIAFLYSIFYFAFSGDYYRIGAFNQSVVYLSYFVGYMLVGFYMPQIVWRGYFVIGIIFIYTLITVFNLNLGSAIPVSLNSIYGGEASAIPNYQIVSLSVLFALPLLYLSRLKNKSRWAVTILLMVFLMGGRSEFLGAVLTLIYLVLIVFAAGFANRLSVSKGALFFFLVVMFAVVGFLYIYTSDFLLLSANRNFQIFDMESNTSWVARQEILRWNIGHIIGSPLFGSFGSHFNYGEGAYIHNILSVWQQYGVIPFVIYTGLLVFPVLRMSFSYFKMEYSWLLVPLAVSFYCLTLMLFSKSYQWPYAGLSVGIFIFVSSVLKKNRAVTNL